MSAAAKAASYGPMGLPQILPIFPLSGVMLLPQARLPLNIFEPRYIAMIEDALGSGRILGIIQPTEVQGAPAAVPAVYRIGGAGRITSVSETEDGRFVIALTGLCRFTIADELPIERPWRRVRPDWNPYLNDLNTPPENAIDRPRLLKALPPYFRAEGISLDRGVIDNAPDDVLVSSLAMICPLEPNEKQALLEAPDLPARAKLLTALLEMACMQGEGETGVKH